MFWHSEANEIDFELASLRKSCLENHVQNEFNWSVIWEAVNGGVRRERKWLGLWLGLGFMC